MFCHMGNVFVYSFSTCVCNIFHTVKPCYSRALQSAACGTITMRSLALRHAPVMLIGARCDWSAAAVTRALAHYIWFATGAR